MTDSHRDNVAKDMASSTADQEQYALTPENFDTTARLRAVDAVDALRDGLNDDDDGSPPQLRTDLLKLHQLAMDVFNRGAPDQVSEMFDFPVELDSLILDLTTSLEQVHETLGQLTALYPENLSYSGLDDAD